MSWLRNAVHRAVEAGGGGISLTTRTVRTSLGTVVHHAGQAVVGGARLINGIGNRYYKSLKQTAKRLEEAALSYRGEERVQLLRRWVVGLKETERAASSMREPSQRSVRGLRDRGADPMNFFHVFLYSQALECVVLSMIMEAPTEEEVSLLSEIFGMCLNGGKDVHNAILSSIGDLAMLFSSYNDEVLAKRDELLQFAQCAISGIKINAEVARLDTEIMQLQQEINAIDAVRANSTRNRNKTSPTVPEDFKTAVAEVRLCSRMEDLVLKKKSIHPGDSLETHFQKVDKLKVLSESLANSSAKAEKRIMENRLQKEESLIFRVTKTTEVSTAEKELETEISGLQKEKDQLEAELNKEDELSRSVASSKVEASTVRAWINFLEDTWKLQSLYEEIKEKQANDELDRCGVCFVNSIKHHVSACVEELSTSIDRIKTFVDNLKIFSDRSVSGDGGDNGPSKQSNPQKYLEEGYLETEKKVVAAFSLADNIRTLTFSNPERRARDNPEVKDLFATIDKLRVEFQSVPRPVLQIEIKEKEERSRRLGSLSFKSSAGTPGHSRTESPIAAQLRTRLPSESDSEPGKLDQDFKEYAADDIGGWEFDELRTGVQ
ncbi:hypothetical protein ACQ4PT_036691 [Festuca glaucescens]